LNSELKIPLAIQADVDEIREWASKKPFVKSVHIFGSHITGGKNPNDLDVALEIEPLRGDQSAQTTWICERKKWHEELAQKLEHKLDLQRYDQNGNPTIKKGLEKGSILIYIRKT
jgi:predicted nucleotidyltransferase